jgi:hypothetical protein
MLGEPGIDHSAQLVLCLLQKMSSLKAPWAEETTNCTSRDIYMIYSKGSIRNLMVMPMPSELQTVQEALPLQAGTQCDPHLPSAVLLASERLAQQLKQLEAAYAPYRAPQGKVRASHK